MRTTSLALRLTPLAMLGVVAIAVPAVAQPTSGAAAPLTVYPACTSQPTKDDSEVAHGAYIAGKRAFDENDYPTAIQYFRDAFRRDCSKYELLNIISRSYELKGDKLEAINALETYLKRAPANDPGSEAIQKRVTNLRAQAAAEASAKATATTTTAVPPTASASTTASASAAPTTTATGAPPEIHGHTVGPWIVAGAGVLAIGVGIPLAIVGAGKVSDANQSIRNLGCNPDDGSCQSDSNVKAAENLANGPRQTGTAEQDIGIVLIGVGAAAVVGGLVWHFLEPTGPAAPTSGKLHVQPETRPGYAGLSVGGSF